MFNLTIKQKLLSLASLMIVSFVVIGGIYGYSVDVQEKASKENNRIANVNLLAEEINVGLLEARRNEKDFLLRQDMKYSEKHQKTMANNLTLVSKLNGQVHDSELLEKIDVLNTLFVEYQSSFNKVVDIQQKVGLDEKQGLLGNLRKSVHDVEDNLKQYENDALQVSMLMMRRHEKDYLAREADKYIEKMNKQQQKFTKLLESSNLPESVKSNITSQMSIYYRDFIALTDGMKQIRGEISDMRDKAHAIEPIFDDVHATMKKLSEQNDHAYTSTQQRVVTIMTATLVLVGLFAIAIVWVIASGIINGVNASVKVAERIALGDLTNDLTITSDDEMGKLQRALQSMTEKLRSIVGEVKQASQNVLQASSEITSGNMELSQRTEEQASSLEETASSMEEMTTTVKESADNASQANKLATSTREDARKGGEVVGRAVKAMNDIKNSSKKIADIINVVEDIAFQTNLLALNAAVEAARAGEQGRGFAVVASEVRTLAGRSAESAKEIRNLIEDSVDKVQTGAELVDASGLTLNEIVTSITKVADIVSEMAAASQEQSAGIEQVNKAVIQMDQMTQQNSALVEEAASASRALQEQAVQLDEVIGFFKVSQAGGFVNHSNVFNTASSPTMKPVSTFYNSKPVTAATGHSEKQMSASSNRSKDSSTARKTGTYDSDWDEF